MELSAQGSENGLIRSRRKIARQYRGAGQFAEIELLVNLQAQAISITFDVAETSREDWKQGVLVGLQYALNRCGNPRCTITITQLRGTVVDTSPGLVAYVAIYALWNVFSYQSSHEEKQRIEQKVYENQKNRIMPNFEENDDMYRDT